jgi:hypothetical protein
MASCELCGIGPIPSPCGIICTTDCSTCWVDAAAMRNKIVLDIGSDVFKSGKPPQLTSSTAVRFCCNELTSGQIADFLNKVYSDARIKRSADEKKISKTVTGTLAEILKQLGLEASAY